MDSTVTNHLRYIWKTLVGSSMYVRLFASLSLVLVEVQAPVQQGAISNDYYKISLH